jgi:hypothetical protein
MIPPEEQRRAVDTALAAITPAALRIPEAVLKLLPPCPPGYPRPASRFQREPA